MIRTIVIGDVHGCYDELQDLLRAVDASAADRLISVGDLICKGPDSRAVLDWAMKTRNLEVVLGNHELRFLSCWRRREIPNEKPYDLATFRQLEDGFERRMRFIDGWPLFIEAEDFVVVHAGFDPLQPLAEQSAWQLSNVRRLSRTDTPWYEEYNSSRVAVFGHWAKPEPLVRRNAVGLDTGCVYGGLLSALILPERRIVSVQARRIYRRKSSWPVLVGLREASLRPAL
jgi:diadenosine tetraphosphatase ApaH/serine/threonine PP2A family protein phosphatase